MALNLFFLVFALPVLNVDFVLNLKPSDSGFVSRLQQDRLEAARIAEELARKAAEEAVRQLEVEHSAKIMIDVLPQINEPYVSQVSDPN